MAPPRKPTALKKLTGTFRADRENPHEPRPRRVRPRPPKSLPAEGRALWLELVRVLDESRIMTAADVVALTLCCEAYAEYRAADAEVQAHGLTYTSETKTGHIVRPHPCVAIRAESWRRVERMLGKFGLTPSDRTRVSERAPQREGRDPWDEVANGYFGPDRAAAFLFGRKGA